MLLPAAPQDWLPAGHLAHSINDTVDALDLKAFYTRDEGGGSRNRPFHPAMMVTQPHLFMKLPSDAFKDFTPVSPLIRNHFFIVVSAASKWKLEAGKLRLLVPAGTPRDVVTKLNDGVRATMKLPDVRDKLVSFTYEDFTMTPAEMAAVMQAELRRWGPVITKAGLKLD